MNGGPVPTVVTIWDCVAQHALDVMGLLKMIISQRMSGSVKNASLMHIVMKQEGVFVIKTGTRKKTAPFMLVPAGKTVLKPAEIVNLVGAMDLWNMIALSALCMLIALLMDIALVMPTGEIQIAVMEEPVVTTPASVIIDAKSDALGPQTLIVLSVSTMLMAIHANAWMDGMEKHVSTTSLNVIRAVMDVMARKIHTVHDVFQTLNVTVMVIVSVNLEFGSNGT